MGLFSFVGKAVKGITKAVKKARDKRDDRKADEAIAKYEKSKANVVAQQNTASNNLLGSASMPGMSGMFPIILIGVVVLFLFMKK